MMKEELEMIEEKKSPFKIGGITFVSFVVLGFIPLIVYVADFFRELTLDLMVTSSTLTIFSFALIGYLKGLVNHTNKLYSILSTVLMGVSAALVAFYVGDFLERMISS
jgi:VIT1/CCC1 family predicted Fe2+/Mn2+ transporter